MYNKSTINIKFLKKSYENPINYSLSFNQTSQKLVLFCIIYLRDVLDITFSTTRIIKNIPNPGSPGTTLFLILYRRQVVEEVTECTLD